MESKGGPEPIFPNGDDLSRPPPPYTPCVVNAPGVDLVISGVPPTKSMEHIKSQLKLNDVNSIVTLAQDAATGSVDWLLRLTDKSEIDYLCDPGTTHVWWNVPIRFSLKVQPATIMLMGLMPDDYAAQASVWDVKLLSSTREHERIHRFVLSIEDAVKLDGLSKAQQLFSTVKRKKEMVIVSWISPAAAPTPSTVNVPLTPSPTGSLPPTPAAVISPASVITLPTPRSTPVFTASVNLLIFHDAENCHIKENVPGSHIKGILTRTENSIVAALGLAPETTQVNRKWNFYLPTADSDLAKDARKFRPNNAAEKSLHQNGLTFVAVGSKKGAVDMKIKADIIQFTDDCENQQLQPHQRSIVVLITGDSDFSADVKRLVLKQYKTVIVPLTTAGQGTSPAFLDLGATVTDSWENILHSVTPSPNPQPAPVAAPANSLVLEVKRGVAEFVHQFALGKIRTDALAHVRDDPSANIVTKLILPKSASISSSNKADKVKPSLVLTAQNAAERQCMFDTAQSIVKSVIEEDILLEGITVKALKDPKIQESLKIAEVYAYTPSWMKNRKTLIGARSTAPRGKLDSKQLRDTLENDLKWPVEFQVERDGYWLVKPSVPVPTWQNQVKAVRQLLPDGLDRPLDNGITLFPLTDTHHPSVFVTLLYLPSNKAAAKEMSSMLYELERNLSVHKVKPFAAVKFIQFACDVAISPEIRERFNCDIKSTFNHESRELEIFIEGTVAESKLTKRYLKNLEASLECNKFELDTYSNLPAFCPNLASAIRQFTSKTLARLRTSDTSNGDESEEDDGSDDGAGSEASEDNRRSINKHTKRFAVNDFVLVHLNQSKTTKPSFDGSASNLNVSDRSQSPRGRGRGRGAATRGGHQQPVAMSDYPDNSVRGGPLGGRGRGSGRGGQQASQQPTSPFPLFLSGRADGPLKELTLALDEFLKTYKEQLVPLTEQDASFFGKIHEQIKFRNENNLAITKLVHSSSKGPRLAIAGSVEQVDAAVDLLKERATNSVVQTIAVMLPPEKRWQLELLLCSDFKAVQNQLIAQVRDTLKREFGFKLVTSINSSGIFGRVNGPGAEKRRPQIEAVVFQSVDAALAGAGVAALSILKLPVEWKYLATDGLLTKLARSNSVAAHNPTKLTHNAPKPKASGSDGALSVKLIAMVNDTIELSLMKGDLLNIPCEAVMNAANSELKHDGGIARSIADAGGALLLEASRKAAPVPVGSSKPTTSGNLTHVSSILHVVHTVVPIFKPDPHSRSTNEPLFRSAVKSALTTASRLGVKSFGICGIGSGIYGWPINLASELIITTVLEWIGEHSFARGNNLQKIMFFDNNAPVVGAFYKTLYAQSNSALPKQAANLVQDVSNAMLAQWSWREDNHQYIPYDEDQNSQIEKAYQKFLDGTGPSRLDRVVGDLNQQKSRSIHIFEGESSAVYVVDFATMTQYNKKTNFARPLKRVEPTAGPSPRPVTFPQPQPIGDIDDDDLPGLRVIFDQSTNANLSALEDFMTSLKTKPAAVAAPEEKSALEGVLRGKPEKLESMKQAIDAALVAAWSTSEEVDVPVDNFVTLQDLQTKVLAALQSHPERKHWQVNFNHKASKVSVTAFGTLEAERAIAVLLRLINEQITLAKKSMFDTPPTWELSDGDPSKELRLVPVATTTNEYKEVVQKFQSGLRCNIVSIDRVQNFFLWEKYALRRAAVAKENGGDPCEHLLYHGTRNTPAATIAVSAESHGIDCRFSGDGCFYGRAAYFAESMGYSQAYASRLPDGSRQVIVAYVTTGKTQKYDNPRPDIRVPAGGHHSVHGPVSTGYNAYMTYNDYQSYPAYIVTFQPV